VTAGGGIVKDEGACLTVLISLIVRDGDFSGHTRRPDKDYHFSSFMPE
jgi:hypothetical protein